jgi:tripartite-type tricarboxylate transporter receptor subunit TctC
MMLAPLQFIVFALVASTFGVTPAHAQDYPTRPVFIVVGPGPDVMARLFAQKLTEAFGQQVLVDIQATAGGVVAARTVAKAAPDGYTMLLSTGVYSIMEVARRDLPFSFLRDFAPVAEIGSLSFVLLATPSLGVSSLAELIALARRKPGEINCASSGVGTTAHLGCERLRQAAGIDIVHVPYKGAADAMTALLGGQVQMFFGGLPPSLPHIRSGRLRALAVTTREPSSLLEGVPPVSATVPGFDIANWQGMFAPASTPSAIIEKIAADVARIAQEKAFGDQLAAQGAGSAALAPAAFAAFLDAERSKYARLVKESGAATD